MYRKNMVYVGYSTVCSFSIPWGCWNVFPWIRGQGGHWTGKRIPNKMLLSDRFGENVTLPWIRWYPVDEWILTKCFLPSVSQRPFLHSEEVHAQSYPQRRCCEIRQQKNEEEGAGCPWGRPPPASAAPTVHHSPRHLRVSHVLHPDLGTVSTGVVSLRRSPVVWIIYWRLSLIQRLSWQSAVCHMHSALRFIKMLFPFFLD